jgi:hypothetical protein
MDSIKNSVARDPNLSIDEKPLEVSLLRHLHFSLAKDEFSATVHRSMATRLQPTAPTFSDRLSDPCGIRRQLALPSTLSLWLVHKLGVSH